MDGNKNEAKNQMGQHRPQLNTPLAEFMWHRKFGTRLLENLIRILQERYPLILVSGGPQRMRILPFFQYLNEFFIFFSSFFLFDMRNFFSTKLSKFIYLNSCH